jgi:hypothetical protein
MPRDCACARNLEHEVGHPLTWKEGEYRACTTGSFLAKF